MASVLLMKIGMRGRDSGVASVDDGDGGWMVLCVAEGVRSRKKNFWGDESST